MFSIIALRQPVVAGGITVAATMQTAIIDPDVNAFYTITSFPLARVLLLGYLNIKDLFNIFIIDAFPILMP